MKHLKDKKDYYEARPLLFIFTGIFGLLAPLIVHPSHNYFQISYISSLILFACSYKILLMRRNYRIRHLPIK